MEEMKTTFTVKEDGFFGEIIKSEEPNPIYKNKILIICPGSNGDFNIVKKLGVGISK